MWPRRRARKNVPTLVEFFGLDLAKRLVSEGRRADLIIGNNVLAQVPDLNDFTAGMAHLLAPNGVITLEFPHLERLIDENQFDTIYHEHFSYFSLVTIDRLAARARAARYSMSNSFRPTADRCACICVAPIAGTRRRRASAHSWLTSGRSDLRTSGPTGGLRRAFTIRSASSCPS